MRILSALSGCLKAFRTADDARREHEVRADIDSEFQFHISAEIARLKQHGHSEAEAARAAMAAFGSAARYRRKCLHVAFLHQMLLLRAVVVASIVLAAALAGMIGLHRHSRHRYAEGIASLQLQLESARQELEAAKSATSLPMAQDIRFVSIRGKVRRPNVWAFDKDTNISLRQLVAKAGGLNADAKGEFVLTNTADPSNGTVTIAPSDWYDTGGPNPSLNVACSIEVR